MSVTRLLFCVTLLSVICFSVGSTVDTNCGNACDAVAPGEAQQQEQFEDLVLPAAPSFIEESAHSDADSEMESEGELVGEFEGGVELEGENTAEIDAQQTIAAMNAAAAKIQAGVGIDTEQEQEMADSVEAEAEADAESETELDTEEGNGATMHSMRFSTGLRKPKGKTTPIRKAAKGKAKKGAKGKAKAKKPAKKAKATKKKSGSKPRRLNLKKKQPKRAAGGGRVTSDRDGDAPWPKPVVRIQRAGEMPIDVGKLTPRVVVVDGQKVKLPPPVVIHQLKGQRSSGKKAEVDPEDPCFDVCHFEGGWSTRRCQQCLFRGMVNGWILHAINDGVVGYNYAHWARNQCVAVKSTNPFHPVTFSDCFFNTIHNACNQ